VDAKGPNVCTNAALTFGKDVPDLSPENSTRESLELGAFLADVCLGDNIAAKKILNVAVHQTFKVFISSRLLVLKTYFFR